MVPLLTLNHLYIAPDPGAASLRVGDMCRYAPHLSLDGELIRAACLDNRAGCMALLLAMQELRDIENEVYCVFSVQEEIGMRGASRAADSIRPDLALVVDLGVASDPQNHTMNPQIHLGGGVIEKVMDDSIICHRDALAWLERSAERAGVPLMPLVGGAGYTNAGGIHTAGSGIPTAIAAIAARGIHTPCETIDINDLTACARILVCSAKEWDFL